MVVYNGLLDIHGTPRIKTWTSLSKTSEIADKTIYLAEATDWQIGE